KVEGEQVWEALLTICNHLGQIRNCNLVPTKAHSQFDLALTRMHASLELYGLQLPRIFFTDTMADKDMLECHFPSLIESVEPVSENDALPLLHLPPEVEILVLSRASDVQHHIFTLIDGIRENDELVIGLDSEWNVDINAQRQGLPDHRQTAILQIAHGTK